jgi:hypothetical protein
MRDRVATYFEKISRPPVLRVICAAAALCVCSCSRGPSSDLAAQYSEEVRLEGDKPAIVALDVQPGAYLVTARERDIDVRLVVDAGGTHAELEDNVPRHGLHATVVSLNVAAKLRVEVRNSEHRRKHGIAEIRIAQWRRTTDKPSELELGYAAFGAAGMQSGLASKESWTRAVDLLHEAIAHFTAAGDERARAQSEYTLAHLEYLVRYEYPPAIRAAQRAGEAYSALGDEMGMTRAATLRAAAELEVASAMNAGTQGAEQRALYASADRTLAQSALWFAEHKLPVDAEYAVNMRGIRAYQEGKYEEAGGYFQRAIVMARANADPGEDVVYSIRQCRTRPPSTPPPSPSGFALMNCSPASTRRRLCSSGRSVPSFSEILW